MEISNNQSWYINPNTRQLTSNVKNTVIKDREAFNGSMQNLLNPVEDLVQVLKTPIKLAERSSLNRQGNSVDIASGSRIAVNDGYILTVKPQGVEVSGGDNLYARWNEGVSDVMGYLGIDASKDFTVNGMKYSKNGNGWFESQADSEAKSAYEMLKANNRTYTFADERTRNQIDYISGYYLEHTLETLLLRIKEFLLWSY